MNYRKEYNKIVTRIENVARKGTEAVYDYRKLIDEIVDGGQFSILEDVFINQFKIDIRQFKSITDLKKETFDIVRQNTFSIFQRDLKKLFDQFGVYSNGFHFYDLSTNKYLGDIKEVEEVENWIAYKDQKLFQKQDEIRVINLEVTPGVSQSIYSAIPPFENDPTKIIRYPFGAQIIYTNNIYECISSYTWSSNNQITPTFSSNWIQMAAPTYSLTIFDDNTVPLLDKYKFAIDKVKSFTYNYV